MLKSSDETTLCAAAAITWCRPIRDSDCATTGQRRCTRYTLFYKALSCLSLRTADNCPHHPADKSFGLGLSRAASAARACRLGAIEETPQEVRQNDKHQGVQQQTTQLGNTLACGDPAAEQLAGQLERLGAGDGNKGGKGNDLLDWVHFIKSTQNFLSHCIPQYPCRIKARLCRLT